MLQTIISSGLTDAIKTVATVAGSFAVIYIKHHIDLVKIKKAEAYVQSKSALDKLVDDVKTAAGEVLTSPEVIHKSAAAIAEFATKKGFKVTAEEVAQILSIGENAAMDEVKNVAQEVQTAAPGSKAVQSPAQKA